MCCSTPSAHAMGLTLVLMIIINQQHLAQALLEHARDAQLYSALQGHAQQESGEACVSMGLSRVAATCSAASNTSGLPPATRPRDALIKLLQQCISTRTGNSSQRVMRILSTASHFADMAKGLVSTYSSLTDIQTYIDTPIAADWMTIAGMSMGAPSRNLTTHEAWIMYSFFTGVGIQYKSYKTLTDLVSMDTRLHWEGLLSILRQTALLYKQEVVSMPLGAMSYFLYYRKDMFTKYNLTVPRTWKELVIASRQYNGTEGMHGFCGLWSNCTSAALIIARSVLASYLQTQGPTQGWLLDPATMELNLNTTVMIEALNIIKGLYSVSPPDNSLALGCPWYSPRFAAGHCLMSIALPSHFKYVSHTSRAAQLGKVQGNLGVAPLPGSEVVYDYSTKTLVPCDQHRCPYAQAYQQPNGTTFWVNLAPSVEFITASVNRWSDPDVVYYAYTILSYLASQQVSDILVFEKDSEMPPTRTYQLDPNRWIAAGWNAADAREFCATLSASLNHPNVNLQIRFPGAANIYGVLSVVLAGLFQGFPAKMVQSQIVQYSLAQLASIYGTNKTALEAEYWASLNRPIIAPSPPPPQPSPPPQYQAPDMASAPLASADRNTLSPGSIVLSVVLPLGALLVVAGLIIGYYRNTRLRRRGHPGAGPFTTLCVTDIEDSTLLWEEVDPRVMDTSVKLHNGCIRNLAAKHGGYESVWEGDSFVVAFHHPSEALSFCMEVQTELMQLAWPEALLRNDHANEVWCRLSNQLGAGVADGGQSKKGKSEPQIDLQILNASTCPASNHHMIPSSSIKRCKEANVSNACSDLDSQGPDTKSTRSRSVTFQVPTKVTSPDAFGGHGTSSCSNQTAQHVGLEALTALPAVADSLDLSQRREPQFSSFGGETLFVIKSGPTESIPAVQGRRGAQNLVADREASTELYISPTLSGFWRKQWLASKPAPAAVQVYKGLRVRLGIHSGVDSQACINFNATMQRYHYTGPVRVISNAIASAGHGGYTLMSTSTAALLDTDGSGLLTDLPPGCGVYYQGKHVLSGVGEALDLLLVLPDTLACRLALQQARLRSQSTVIPGILSTPIPTAAATDSTALVYVQFSGLSTLMAWDAEETRAALLTAQTALHDTMTACQGVLSEDGLQPLLSGRHGRGLWTVQYPDAITKGLVVCVFGAPEWPGSTHPSFSFAQAVQQKLHDEDWSDKLMNHALCDRITSTISQGPAANAASRQAARDHSLDTIPAALQTGRRTNPELECVPSQSIGMPEETNSSSAGMPHVKQARGNSMPSLQQLGWASASHGSITSKATSAAETLPTSVCEAASIHQSAEIDISVGNLSRTGVVHRTGKQYMTLTTSSLRGLRVKIVIVSARKAAFAIATHSSGRAVFAGRPVKKAIKLLGKAKPGQIVVAKRIL